MAKRIVVNPKVMLGKPVFAGTRIPVEVVLEKLAAGQTTKEILLDYPRLTKVDIYAAIEFASNLVRKTHPPHAPRAFHEIPG